MRAGRSHARDSGGESVCKESVNVLFVSLPPLGACHRARRLSYPFVSASPTRRPTGRAQPYLLRRRRSPPPSCSGAPDTTSRVSPKDASLARNAATHDATPPSSSTLPASGVPGGVPAPPSPPLFSPLMFPSILGAGPGLQQLYGKRVSAYNHDVRSAGPDNTGSTVNEGSPINLGSFVDSLGWTVCFWHHCDQRSELNPMI